MHRREFLATSAAASLAGVLTGRRGIGEERMADLILMNGRLATLDKQRPLAEAASIKDGRFTRVGSTTSIPPEGWDHVAVTGELKAASWAEQQVASVRDDPAGRLALMERCYHGPFGEA